ncbi:MAG: septation protein A [Kiloniellaceae bacterium]
MTQVTRTSPRLLKPAVEYGPLAVFFVSYWNFGLLTATGALMAATAAALAVSLVVSRRLPWMPLITAAVVAVFGGLTLWLEDETFIKMKPTIVQGLFSAALLGGLALGRPLLKPLLGAAWPMHETGWRRLSLRFGVFFAAMAGLNEVVWRTQSTDFWVTFKVFGLVGLTLIFAVAQAPLMARHRLRDDATDKSG